MDRVITYRLAYLDREVTLCAQCAASDAHGCGVLGPVQRGAHRGECEGDLHAAIGQIIDDESGDRWEHVPGPCAGEMADAYRDRLVAWAQSADARLVPHDSRSGAAITIRVPHARDAYLTVRA